MDNTRLPYSFSINYPSKNRILFFLSRLNSKQDTCWVLDYSTGFSISRYKYALPFNVVALFEKSDGTFKPYLGDYAGTVYQSDQGTTDNNQPINDYYVTGDQFIKSPTMSNKWFFLDIRGVNGSTSQSVTISYYLNGGDTPVQTDSKILADVQTLWGASQPMIWGQSTWSKQGLVNRTSEINNTSKTIRMKLESTNKLTDTLTVEGFTLAGDPLGTLRG